MKQFIFLFICMVASLCLPIHAQEYVMTAPVGYGEGTTGGGDATPEIVRAYSDLNDALSSTDARVILVEGRITFPEDAEPISIRSNKTLIGLPGAILEVYPVPQDERKANGDGSGLLRIGSSESNIIIRNLIFQGPGAWDTNTGSDLLTNRGGTKIWVDHCEFYDGMDGNFDNTNRADNITVSWCKFGYTIPTKPFIPPGGSTNNHRYSALVGASDNDSPVDGQYSITFACIHWGEGCNQRMPRARNAQLHILNCYYNTPGSGVSIGLGAGNVSGTTCYVENCDFKDVNIVSNTGYPGTKTVALTFVGCIGKQGDDVGVASRPDYSYTPIAAVEVETAVTGKCGAGATLKVGRNGSISAGCDIPLLFLAPPTSTATQKVTSGEDIQAISFLYRGSANGFDIVEKPDWLNENRSGNTITFTGSAPKILAATNYSIVLKASDGTLFSSEMTANIHVMPLQ